MNNRRLPCLYVAALRDPLTMERANLLNMAKLSIKGLIESALSFGRTLDSDYPPLQQFFVVMEHCLKHGLKGERREEILNDFTLGFCTSSTMSIQDTPTHFLCPSSKEVLSGF